MDQDLKQHKVLHVLHGNRYWEDSDEYESNWIYNFNPLKMLSPVIGCYNGEFFQTLKKLTSSQ